jgi:hypothetical protein
MSRTLVLLVTAALALAASATAPGSPTRATLRLSDAQPVTLTGLRFHPREHVRVTVTAESGRRSRVVLANRRGALVATFAGLSTDRCSGLSALAVGGRGSRAAFKLVPLGCPPSP